ncbi:DUF1134 domain-containing protein [Sphingomonas crocodyli]|uniref:DUF1134 domain-containing protein n=2 Tax=Sphingomonas crocodyli TaxID=1979270 RepID=A0A437M183_9SPHN|nr:DUF1134 domain-containing protein [Sphingomonas crocodyli]RVT91303.1 DUF1134 domain-containing protein [Sphingomonas crocodyli]
MSRFGIVGIALLSALALPLAPVAAQAVKTVDPNAAAQADLAPADPVAEDGAPAAPPATPSTADAAATAEATPAPASTLRADAAQASQGGTYNQDDVVAAAEGVFGKGAEGLAKMIEKVLKDQGQPNGYIAGREVGGAVVVGLRYGSGTLFHKVEGQMPVYWTGPSLGFDFGANGAKSFVLVYNLYDSGDLFHRYPAAEGTAYVIGGFTASYLRRGDVVLIPIRLGVGWRLGVNVGYMNITRESKWLPF